jgi:glyoxylase I family protein
MLIDMEDMPLLTGTVTVILTVRNLETSAAWYRAVLDAGEVGRYAEPDGYLAQVVLREPATGMVLCLVQHREGAEEPFDERRVGLDHLEFGVPSEESLREWAARLDELGIPHSGVKTPGYTSNRMITFRDPDDIQLEFFYSA